MICPFCSLLCDADELASLQCSRRTATLERIAARQIGTLSDTESRLAKAKEALHRAKRVLVTGRITSVGTARAAVAFAAKFQATLDCAESGRLFNNVLAIQRSGLNSNSIAEARDHSDLLIVVGNDALLQAVPRTPSSLRNPSKQQTVLLLGDFGRESVVSWRSAGFDTWAVQCELKDVPKALSQWSRWADPIWQGRELQGIRFTRSHSSQLFQAMAGAAYTTVLWSVESLGIAQADLWVERMLQWIASRNETSRCAGLPWASADGTMMQVCTWLTGFPGRITFRDGIPDYDPVANSYERWIGRNANSPVHDSVVVLIDETMNSDFFLLPSMREMLENHFVIELSPHSEAFPTAIAGHDHVADMFRADQTLLAHVDPAVGMPSGLQSATTWLERLTQR